MTQYETWSLLIAGLALAATIVLAIWAHNTIKQLNFKIQNIQNIQKISTSGGHSPIISTSGQQNLIISTSGGQSLVISGSNVQIYSYTQTDNRTT